MMEDRNRSDATEPQFRTSTLAQVMKLDTSAFEQMYQIRIANRRLEINENVFSVVQFLEQPRTRSELASFVAVLAPDEDPELRSTSLLSELQRCGAVIRTDSESGESADGAASAVTRRNPMTLQVRLLKRAQIVPLSSRLKLLFERRAVEAGIAAILLSHGIFFLQDKVLAGIDSARMVPLSPGEWLIAIGSVYGSVLFHELGHCSACEHCGIEHGEIGIGILFIYPVFYADVSDCWSLSRWKRIIVGSGGLYFQLLLASGVCIVYAATGDRLARVFVYSTLLCAALNLNPFLRMDGYWLMADVLGIPNLYHASSEAFRYLLKRFRHQQPGELPVSLRRPAWVLIALGVFAAGAVVFFTYCSILVGFRLIPQILFTQLPRGIHQLGDHLSRFDLSSQFLRVLLLCLFSCVTLVGATRFLVGAVRRVMAGARTIARQPAAENRHPAQPGPVD